MQKVYSPPLHTLSLHFNRVVSKIFYLASPKNRI